MNAQLRELIAKWREDAGPQAEQTAMSIPFAVCADELEAALAAPKEAGPVLIGWRSADYTMETADKSVAQNWAANISVLPIFAGDPNTKLANPPGDQRQEGTVAVVPYAQHEREVLAVIHERDRYEEAADELAALIAAITGEDIGEHSSANNPWAMAKFAAEEWLERKAASPPPEAAAAVVLKYTDPDCVFLSQGADDVPCLQVPGQILIRFIPGSWDRAYALFSGNAPTGPQPAGGGVDDAAHTREISLELVQRARMPMRSSYENGTGAGATTRTPCAPPSPPSKETAMQADKLRALLADASPGPWACCDGPMGYQHRLYGPNEDPVADVIITRDAALIAAMHAALPELLAIAEAAEDLRADAMRYRWLRDNRTEDLCVRTRGDNPIHPHLWGYYEIDGRKLDVAIDKKLAALSTVAPVREDHP